MAHSLSTKGVLLLSKTNGFKDNVDSHIKNRIKQLLIMFIAFIAVAFVCILFIVLAYLCLFVWRIEPRFILV